jgi:multidrug efflux pump subunit AcrA (membrane-fusion protein)
VDVNNPTGQLIAGSYAQVHFKVPQPAPTLIIPVDALLFRAEGLRVAVVRNGVAELVKITPGRDFGDTIEILSGLRANDSVIISPPDSIVSGEKVRVTRLAAGTSGGS